jgi:addiction module HigA family antidote
MAGPITPGEILLEEYLKPMGISQNAMARALGVPPRAINEIVLGKRAISPVMSIRFGKFFNQSEHFWHGIQVECDFRALAKRRKQIVAKVRPVQELLALDRLCCRTQTAACRITETVVCSALHTSPRHRG